MDEQRAKKTRHLPGIFSARNNDSPQTQLEEYCKALFGSYVEAHEDHDVTNGMKGHTFASLFLGPTANWQGTSKFFDIITGKVKKSRTFTKYPMPDRILQLSNEWGLHFRKKKRRRN